jgi:adenosine deaminase
VRDLRQLPKAHLHTHLESTIRPDTIRQLGGDPPVRDQPFTSFREFADRRAGVRALLRDYRHFRRIAEEFCQDEAAQGVRLELATRYPQVIAIGLAGDESHPAAPFAEVLQAAREAGLHLVHHAGETAGPASVWEAITVGHAERIGHGIRVLEDPDLVAELSARRLPLEVCPSSNVLLGLVPSLAEHPLPQLVEAGLVVTLNTDGETSLVAEYERARQLYGYSDAELAALAQASVEASFAPPELKTQLSIDIKQWSD